MIDNRLDRDALLILCAAFLRSSTVGLVGVLLAIHLSEVGLSSAGIGAAIAAGLAGGAVATLLVGIRGDAFGRRRTLMGLALIGTLGYVGLAVAGDAVTLVPLAFAGMLNGMGRDRGAASALEQAILPETTTDTGRTWVLAWYNVVLDVGHAFGALAAAAPTLLMAAFDTGSISAHRLTFLLCAGATATTVALYAVLSVRVETMVDVTERTERQRPGADTRRVVRRLAMLFALDGVGGGLLSSALIAYWFFRRYGSSEAEMAVLFFAARILNAGSHLMAAWIARRIGLLNTMVLTHLPSSLFLMAAPIAPTAGLASLLFLSREALVEMDVPTRQSYVMAVVPPRDRTFASGVTNVTRNVAWAVGPAVAGVVMQYALAGPLVIGGTLKIGYDLLLYGSFRRITPPEEKHRS